MWPSIFDLAIAGLGKILKSILFLNHDDPWGGVIPLIQGRICDIDLTNPAGIFGISCGTTCWFCLFRLLWLLLS
jgi:FHS family L-fucose permease-like MFS transporter